MNVVDESYWMIRRALENAKAIGLTVSNATEFDNWVIVNVTMSDEQDWT